MKVGWLLIECISHTSSAVLFLDRRWRDLSYSALIQLVQAVATTQKNPPVVAHSMASTPGTILEGKEHFKAKPTFTSLPFVTIKEEQSDFCCA